MAVAVKESSRLLKERLGQRARTHKGVSSDPSPRKLTSICLVTSKNIMFLLCSINALGLRLRKRVFFHDPRQRVRLDFVRFSDALLSDLRVLDSFCAVECRLLSFNI